MLVYLPFILPFHILIVYGIIRVLNRLGASRNVVIFAAFTLFGSGSGLLATLAGRSEQWAVFNIISIPVADEISIWAFREFGNTHSFFTSSTVPWIFLIPQVAFFTSVVIWSFLGLIAQLFVGRARNRAEEHKATQTKPIKSPVIVLSLTAIVLLTTGALYYQSGAYLGPKPYAVLTQPTAFYAPPPRPPDVPTIDTWQTESVNLEYAIISAGLFFKVMFIVEHTGDTAGWAVFEVKTDGVVRGTYHGYINPGDRGPISFMMAFPFPGEYTITLKNLSQKLQVVQGN